MAKKKTKPEMTPFELVKAQAEADLLAVAEHFVNAAEKVRAGDMDAMDVLFARLPGWHQMLMIRHEVRMDSLRTDAEKEAVAQTTAAE